MADPLSPAEQIRARHEKTDVWRTEEGPHCAGCSDPWPCDASLLLAALSEAEAEREDYAKFYRYWRDRAERAEARLEAVEGAVKCYQELDHDSCTAERGEELREQIRAALAQEHTEPQEQPHGK